MYSLFLTLLSGTKGGPTSLRGDDNEVSKEVSLTQSSNSSIAIIVGAGAGFMLIAVFIAVAVIKITKKNSKTSPLSIPPSLAVGTPKIFKMESGEKITPKYPKTPKQID